MVVLTIINLSIAIKYIMTYSCTNILDCIVDNSEKEWNDTEELCEDIIYI